MRPLPSFRSIEAFVTVARSDSLTAAARRLGLSLPALSRRIHLLEADLGTPLLRRMPRGIALTQSGADYLAAIGTAVDDLHAATEAVRDGVARKAVRVSLISAFANNWLIPRFADFTRRYPGTEIDLQTSTDFVDMDAGKIDLAIRLGEGDWPSLRAEMLLPIDIFPVCSPEVAADIRSPIDLMGRALIGPAHRPEFWPEWISGAGLDPASMPQVRPIDGFLLYEVAANGMGVAIGLEPIVRPFLASGRLRRPLDVAVRSTRSFHLVRAPGAQPRSVRSIQRWLMAQARADRALQDAV